MGIILKDWYGKDQTFEHDRIWVRDTEGGLVPFTKGTGEVALESLEVTENGTYTPPYGVDGFNSVEVNVEEEGNVFILSNFEATGFAEDSTYGAYSKALTFGTDLDAFELVVGAEYTVGWDDELYTTVAKDTGRVIEENAGDGSTAYHALYYLGNGTLLNYDGLEGNGEPFVILYTSGTGLTLVTTDTADSHVLGLIKRSRPREVLDMMLESITIKENGTYTADPIYDGLKQVTVEVEAASADLHYVTFMSYDGLTEYGKKAVADGDDCADPIARGIFDTPTRESDAQYNYTFNGWATESNGAAVSNWNNTVTEDKTVYAAFNGAVRYYTITYYDDDGTTVLKTESLAYGAMPSYKPEKEGYGFGGWSPELATVTKDASYTVVWAEKITFANGSWADIARISEAGQATDYFAVGDEKTFVYNGTESLTAKIIGFDHEDIADGTGKAGITCIITPAITSTTTNWTGYASYNTTYVDSNLHKALGGTVLNSLPTEMQSVIKAVNKQYSTKTASGYSDVVGTVSTKLWALSRFEVYSDLTSNSNITDIGDMYEGLSSLIKGLLKAGTASVRSFYWRDISRGSNAQPFISIYKSSKLSTVACDASTNLKTAQRQIACCFCI